MLQCYRIYFKQVQVGQDFSVEIKFHFLKKKVYFCLESEMFTLKLRKKNLGKKLFKSYNSYSLMLLESVSHSTYVFQVLLWKLKPDVL